MEGRVPRLNVFHMRKSPPGSFFMPKLIISVDPGPVSVRFFYTHKQNERMMPMIPSVFDRETCHVTRAVRQAVSVSYKKEDANG